jgi:N-acetylglucosaminyl-diphospho-decaprenol L-rhamnosyltransferase
MKLYVSVVSHAHGLLALSSMQQLCSGLDYWVNTGALHYSAKLIHNTVEPEIERDECLDQASSFVENGGASFSPIGIGLAHQWNRLPLGFAANHNESMQSTQALNADWLLIANPDLDWSINPTIAAVLSCLRSAPSNVGAISLTQILPNGERVEFCRRLVTPWQLIKRVAYRILSRTTQEVPLSQTDWMNAACLLVRREAFDALGGFDERYQLYCEDIDFCLRLRMAGWELAVLDAIVVHDTRRDSARQLKFFVLHVISLLKLWMSKTYWKFLWWRAIRRKSIVQLSSDVIK